MVCKQRQMLKAGSDPPATMRSDGDLYEHPEMTAMHSLRRSLTEHLNCRHPILRMAVCYWVAYSKKDQMDSSSDDSLKHRDGWRRHPQCLGVSLVLLETPGLQHRLQPLP